MAPNLDNMESPDNASTADTVPTAFCTDLLSSAPRTGTTQESSSINPTQSQDTARSALSNISIQDLRLIIRALKAPAPPMPEFSGLNHEDPKAFIQECETYFEQSGAEPLHWTRIVSKSLLEEAGKWWGPFKSFNLPWDKFKELFRHKYASQSVENGLRVSLYSRKQGDKEPTAIFLQKKYLLARRLCPQNTEAELVNTVLETLRPSIKRVIRAADPKTFTLRRTCEEPAVTRRKTGAGRRPTKHQQELNTHGTTDNNRRPNLPK